VLRETIRLGPLVTKKKTFKARPTGLSSTWQAHDAGLHSAGHHRACGAFAFRSLIEAHSLLLCFVTCSLALMSIFPLITFPVHGDDPSGEHVGYESTCLESRAVDTPCERSSVR
jgi:hypothetical protein